MATKIISLLFGSRIKTAVSIVVACLILGGALTAMGKIMAMYASYQNHVLVVRDGESRIESLKGQMKDLAKEYSETIETQKNNILQMRKQMEMARASERKWRSAAQKASVELEQGKKKWRAYEANNDEGKSNLRDCRVISDSLQ